MLIPTNMLMKSSTRGMVGCDSKLQSKTSQVTKSRNHRCHSPDCDAKMNAQRQRAELPKVELAERLSCCPW